MKILLADDHDLVRDAIRLYLTGVGIESEMVANVDEAAERIAAEDNFDLILLDYTMPGMNGLDGLERVLDLVDVTPVALISGTATKRVVDKAITLGAAGFLPKTMPIKSIVNAIRFLAAGETYIPIDYIRDEKNKEVFIAGAKPTERELEVLEGICRGESNKEIARDLDLQEVTIKMHVKAIFKKIGARNRTHAAIIAREHIL